MIFFFLLDIEVYYLDSGLCEFPMSEGECHLIAMTNDLEIMESETSEEWPAGFNFLFL